MEDDTRSQADRDREHAQFERRHILMVNRSPALLDFVRATLHDADYNVTTTNAVPLTFALISAARPDLIIIDLAVSELSGWDLLVRLHAEATTAGIPVVVTAEDDRLLAHADRHPDLFGGQAHLVAPFSTAGLHAAAYELIGAA